MVNVTPWVCRYAGHERGKIVAAASRAEARAAAEAYRPDFGGEPVVAVWALGGSDVSKWAGADDEARALHAEIARLRGILVRIADGDVWSTREAARYALGRPSR